MNRKQKRELHQRQSTRQLMGIAHITPHGIRTETGERVFILSDRITFPFSPRRSSEAASAPSPSF